VYIGKLNKIMGKSLVALTIDKLREKMLYWNNNAKSARQDRWRATQRKMQDAGLHPAFFNTN